MARKKTNGKKKQPTKTPAEKAKEKKAKAAAEKAKAEELDKELVEDDEEEDPEDLEDELDEDEDEETSEDTSPESDTPTEDGEDVAEGIVVVEYGRGKTTFTAFDPERGKARNMTLKKGKNDVPLSLYSFFEKSKFFSEKILPIKGLVKVVSRPAESVDEVDI